MSQKILKIATRKSPLALWQANHIKNRLLDFWPHLEVQLVPMVTSGDRFLKTKLQEKGGKGLFVKELETALFNFKADIAVHSMKDVPTTLPEGLCLSTLLKRDNPLDALVSAKPYTLETLPPKSVIGTSSLRRQSQLLKYRPDLEIKLLRGNIHTRLEKLAQGAFDAIILAAAGLERMGLDDRINQMLPPEIMLPACAQGALGVECREDDKATQALLAPLHDEQTAICVQAERKINQFLGGHCHVPIAIFCDPLNESNLRIKARILSTNGTTMLEELREGDKTKALTFAQEIAQSLMAQGGQALIEGAGYAN